LGRVANADAQVGTTDRENQSGDTAAGANVEHALARFEEFC